MKLTLILVTLTDPVNAMRLTSHCTGNRGPRIHKSRFRM